MLITTKLKTVVKLAVVSKDYATYYIPGKTVISGKTVNQIDDYPEYFLVVDAEGDTLTQVSKKVPYVADYADVHEVPDIEELGADLVSFGNFLLERYGVMVMTNDGTNTPAYQREVTHADLCNWQETFIK